MDILVWIHIAGLFGTAVFMTAVFSKEWKNNNYGGK